MKFIENRRFNNHKVVELDNGDKDYVTLWSKRGAEFDACDFDMLLSQAWAIVRAKDDFGIVSLSHGQFEFLVEKTNLGFNVRGFDCGSPTFSLDKLVSESTLGELLQ